MTPPQGRAGAKQMQLEKRALLAEGQQGQKQRSKEHDGIIWCPVVERVFFHFIWFYWIFLVGQSRYSSPGGSARLYYLSFNLLLVCLFLILSAWPLMAFKLAKPKEVRLKTQAEDGSQRPWWAMLWSLSFTRRLWSASENFRQKNDFGQTLNFFCKSPGGKYFRLCGPCNLCHNHTVLWQQHEINQRQAVNKWA